MGNAVTWQNHELAYLKQREWKVLRDRLFSSELEISRLLQVFRVIDYKKRGQLARVEFYLHFKYPFITPM